MKEKRDSEAAEEETLARGLRLACSTDELLEHLGKVVDRARSARRALQCRGDNRLGELFPEEASPGHCAAEDIREALDDLQDLQFYAETAREALRGHGLYSLRESELRSVWKSGDLETVGRLGTADKARTLDIVIREQRAASGRKPAPGMLRRLAEACGRIMKRLPAGEQGGAAP